jgi:hypothetical protein
MSRRRFKYTDLSIWKIVDYVEGSRAAGPRPPTPPSPAAGAWRNQLPPPAPLFTGVGMERPEDYEARQRRQRVARLLAKHNIGQRPGPWWRT